MENGEGETASNASSVRERRVSLDTNRDAGWGITAGINSDLDQLGNADAA